MICPCNASVAELTNTEQRTTHNRKKRKEEENNSNTKDVTNNNNRNAVQLSHLRRANEQQINGTCNAT
jgi:hypothetical protein